MIFEIGYPKTATRSVAAAVGFLYASQGGKFRDAWHGVPTVLEQETLSAILGGGHWAEWFQDYKYLGGFPVTFWRRLADELPDAKFILTMRPIDDWWISIRNMSSRGARSRRRKLTSGGMPLDWFSYQRIALFGSLEPNVQWTHRYCEHNRAVIERFDSGPERDRLAVFKVWEGSGWKELCDFMGEPVPPVDFPRTKNGPARMATRNWYKTVEHFATTETGWRQ